MAVRVSREQGVLVLSLDTAHSPVNIFDRSTAEELRAALEQLARCPARAVILRSDKPESFVNGVGLMLASSLRGAQDAARLSAPVRAAYRALRDCPVPTVAAIQGNTYGCGVELCLECDYRIAADTPSTHFYMTEIPEYLFIPAFGGTQRLPRLLGLTVAADFVLWGERWCAQEARDKGLVDEVVSAKDLTVRALDAALRVSNKRRAWERPRPASEKSVDGILRRIGALPPLYRPLYRRCLSLMVQGARKKKLAEADYARELLASAGSILSPNSKAALAFFFIRQAAREIDARLGPSQVKREEWERALLEPIHRWGDRKQALSVLHHFGFYPLPGLSLNRVNGAKPTLPEIVPAVCLSLVAAVLEGRQTGRVHHVTQADVAARDFLGFPLARTSLCRYATTARVRRWVKSSKVRSLLAPHVIEAARDYGEKGQDFYLG